MYTCTHCYKNDTLLTPRPISVPRPPRAPFLPALMHMHCSAAVVSLLGQCHPCRTTLGLSFYNLMPKCMLTSSRPAHAHASHAHNSRPVLLHIDSLCSSPAFPANRASHAAASSSAPPPSLSASRSSRSSSSSASASPNSPPAPSPADAHAASISFSSAVTALYESMPCTRRYDKRGRHVCGALTCPMTVPPCSYVTSADPFASREASRTVPGFHPNPRHTPHGGKKTQHQQALAAHRPTCMLMRYMTAWQVRVHVCARTRGAGPHLQPPGVVLADVRRQLRNGRRALGQSRLRRRAPLRLALGAQGPQQRLLPLRQLAPGAFAARGGGGVAGGGGGSGAVFGLCVLLLAAVDVGAEAVNLRAGSGGRGASVRGCRHGVRLGETADVMVVRADAQPPTPPPPHPRLRTAPSCRRGCPRRWRSSGPTSS